MSRWDKWEPFPTVMAPEMCRGAFFSCPSLSIFPLSEKTQAFSALSSFQLVYVPRFFVFFLNIFIFFLFLTLRQFYHRVFAFVVLTC